ncbi:MAG: sugar ABC transporter permease [Anaerolineales bacterium]|nr:sugar ABC transporter permease [Anaerolineales bacterium]
MSSHSTPLTPWQIFWQSKKNKRRVSLVLRYLLAFVVLTFSLTPVLFTISSAFSPIQGISTRLIPDNATLNNFREVLFEHDFGLWMLNTTKLAIVSSVMSALITTLTAYAFSRFRFAGRGQLLLGILIIQVFPALMAMVALFAIMDQLGTYIPWIGLNTHGGLIFLYMGGSMGINVWLMKGFFDSIPRDIDESGMIDGATDWQRFWYLIFPLVRPIIVVVTILTFFMVYGDWAFPRIMIRKSELFTVMLGLQQLIANDYGNQWAVFAAGAVLGSILPVSVYLILQEQIVGGLTAGSVKG